MEDKKRDIIILKKSYSDIIKILKVINSYLQEQRKEKTELNKILQDIIEDFEKDYSPSDG